MAVVINYDVNYDSIQEAEKSLEAMNTSTDQATDKSEVLNKATSSLGDKLQGFANHINIAGVGLGDFASKSVGATKGVKGLTTGFKALDVVLRASVIGVIVGAVVTLGVALTKTAKGADFLEKSLAVLQGVANGILDVFINIDQLFSRNIVDVFERNINQSIKLSDATLQLRKNTRKLGEEITQLEANYEVLNQRADDATLSLAEQRKASEEAAATALELARKNADLAKREAELGSQRIKDALSRNEVITEDELDAQAERRNAVTQALYAIRIAEAQNAQRIRQIDQDQFEQRLDFLIDFTDNAKAINERQLADQNIALEERQKILDETVKFTNQAFDEAFAAFEEQAGQRIDFNMLIKESDAEVVSEYLKGTKLSEIETTRVLEFLRERKVFNQDLADEQRALNEEAQERAIRDVEARVALTEGETEAQIQALKDRRDLLLQDKKLTDNERLLITKETEDEITRIQQEANAKRAEDDKALADARIELERGVSESLVGFIDQVAGSNEQLGIAALAFEKTLAIADILINLQKELSAIAVNAAANPANAVTAGAAGVAQFASLAALAKARAGLGIATVTAQTIQGFHDGGINIGGPDGIDKIPAMIERGESVMTARETRDFLPTLQAIRGNKVDPDLLNGLSSGDKSPKVHNNVIEVPRDQINIDEDGFVRKMISRTRTMQVKQNRFKF